jgi:two-component system chemotaxis response regulator CheY
MNELKLKIEERSGGMNMSDLSKINKIMLIDDDEIHSNLCYELIIKSGITDHVSIFNDAEEALRYIRKNATEADLLPDLIFLDINMPFMDGWEFLDAYEAIKPDLKKEIVLILLTSSVYKNDIEKAKQYKSVVEYIKTPISINKLLETKDEYFKKVKVL